MVYLEVSENQTLGSYTVTIKEYGNIKRRLWFNDLTKAIDWIRKNGYYAVLVNKVFGN